MKNKYIIGLNIFTAFCLLIALQFFIDSCSGIDEAGSPVPKSHQFDRGEGSGFVVYYGLKGNDYYSELQIDDYNIARNIRGEEIISFYGEDNRLLKYFKLKDLTYLKFIKIN